VLVSPLALVSELERVLVSPLALVSELERVLVTARLQELAQVQLAELVLEHLHR
jgi:hypothetical protein